MSIKEDEVIENSSRASTTKRDMRGATYPGLYVAYGARRVVLQKTSHTFLPTGLLSLSLQIK